MTLVDVLSDTVYRQQAVQQLHQLLGNNNHFPVELAQIHGLRQIARQEPERVEGFADHQRKRAERKCETASVNAQQRLVFEIEFWTLVVNLCNGTTSDWSVIQERDSRIPADLQNRPDMSRRERREIGERRNEWCERWNNEHIPAFFERFCTHCLFCIAKAEMGQLASENANKVDELAQQDQSNSQDGGAMQTAFQQANRVE